MPLPSLITARQNPASVLLESLTAFCFCGVKDKTGVSTVERIEAADHWITLTLSYEIPKTWSVGAAHLVGKIAVFAGSAYYSLELVMLSEEGESLEDKS